MMQTELTPDVYKSHSQYEQQKRWRAIFHQVLEAYIDARSLPAICAINYDDSLPNRKLNADAIHFITDVEHAVAKAIGNDAELHKQWLLLVEGGQTSATAVAKLAVSAGRIFDCRGLLPHLYFRHIRKGRPDRRPATCGAV
jgi:hypothetical protein